MSEDNLNVPSLNDENYSLWVVWMEADLITCRLYNQVVCEMNTKEMTAEDAKTATADWKKKNKKNGKGSGGHYPKGGGFTIDTYA